MQDYKVLKVKLTKEQSSHHCLFYKPHKLSSQKNQAHAELAARTLFVYNVPPYTNESALGHVFSCFGRVERTLLFAKPQRNPFAALERPPSFFKKRYGLNENDEFSVEDDPDGADTFCFQVAYLIFAESDSIERAVSKPLLEKVRFFQETSSVSGKTPSIKVGFQKWISDYEAGLINEAKLSKEIDKFMQTYDAEKEQEDKKAEGANQPDEDGWITVTAKSRKANRPFTEKNLEKIHKKQKKKRQQMQLINFYSFQMKESKKEYIAQLRKKFEEDKKKIETMKSTRKFKPF